MPTPCTRFVGAESPQVDAATNESLSGIATPSPRAGGDDDHIEQRHLQRVDAATNNIAAAVTAAVDAAAVAGVAAVAAVAAAVAAVPAAPAAPAAAASAVCADMCIGIS